MYNIYTYTKWFTLSLCAILSRYFVILFVKYNVHSLYFLYLNSLEYIYTHFPISRFIFLSLNFNGLENSSCCAKKKKKKVHDHSGTIFLCRAITNSMTFYFYSTVKVIRLYGSVVITKK